MKAVELYDHDLPVCNQFVDIYLGFCGRINWYVTFAQGLIRHCTFPAEQYHACFYYAGWKWSVNLETVIGRIIWTIYGWGGKLEVSFLAPHFSKFVAFICPQWSPALHLALLMRHAQRMKSTNSPSMQHYKPISQVHMSMDAYDFTFLPTFAKC